MFIVAITRLASSVDEEAPRLAADLGVTAFEVRQSLLPGLPAVILATPDKARAVAIGSGLRARGHDVVAIDSRSMTRAGGARILHHFRLEPGGLVADTPGGPQRLPYGDLAVLLHATHERRTEHHDQRTVKKLSASAAIITGGIMISKKVKIDRTTHAQDTAQVLYLFFRQGPPPWILPEVGATYSYLGDRMAKSQRENFLTTLDLLRSSAPHATYDERLLRHRVPEWVRVAAAKALLSPADAPLPSDPAVDLLAHLLALWLSRQPRPQAP